jgi:hypothetical protein
VYPARYMVERFSFAVHEHRKSVLVSAATGQPWVVRRARVLACRAAILLA